MFFLLQLHHLTWTTQVHSLLVLSLKWNRRCFNILPIFFLFQKEEQKITLLTHILLCRKSKSVCTDVLLFAQKCPYFNGCVGFTVRSKRRDFRVCRFSSIFEEEATRAAYIFSTIAQVMLREGLGDLW